jgi:hypothetical protein
MSYEFSLFGARARMTFVAALILGASACGDPATTTSSSSPATSGAPAASTASKPTTSATATASSAAMPSSSAQTATNDLPTQADFEDEAEQDIGTDNLADELGKLEKELDAK